MFLTDFPDIFGMPVDETSSPIHEINVITPPLGDEAIRSPRHQMFSDIPTPAYNQTSFQPHDRPSAFPMAMGAPQQQQPSHQQPQQPQQQYADYDTGFIPLRPSYDAPMYEHQYQAEGFGSLNSTLQPGNSKEARQARRESGMLLMNMGMQNAPRKGSNPRIRDEYNPRMVREETAFE
jgi:RalA-binding protein 1